MILLQSGKDVDKRRSIFQYDERSIRYVLAKSCNNIPLKIKQSPSVMSFRRQLKLHLFSSNYQV